MTQPSAEQRAVAVTDLIEQITGGQPATDGPDTPAGPGPDQPAIPAGSAGSLITNQIRAHDLLHMLTLDGTHPTRAWPARDFGSGRAAIRGLSVADAYDRWP